MPPYFSVVIPTYNRRALLAQTLDALTQQTERDVQVIIVDDGSTDGTAEFVQRTYPQFHYLAQKNRGPATARNRGIATSTGEIIAFTDDDVIVPLDWLARLKDGYTRFPQVAGVGGYLLADAPVLRTSVIAQYEQWYAQSLGVGNVETLGGWECPVGGTNNMSYRRTILDQVGGFDESFTFAAGEDADLKWRICQRGERLLFVPVRATHLQPYTWSCFLRQARTRGKGKWQFQKKYAGVSRTRVHILAGLIYRGFRMSIDLFRLPDPRFAIIRFAEAWSIARGEWEMQ